MTELWASMYKGLSGWCLGGELDSGRTKRPHFTNAAECTWKWKIKDLGNTFRLNSLKVLQFHLSCRKGISFYRSTVFFPGIHPSRPANIPLDRWNFKAMYCISWDGCLCILCLLTMLSHDILYQNTVNSFWIYWTPSTYLKHQFYLAP